jgi:hypothetical protein
MFTDKQDDLKGEANVILFQMWVDPQEDELLDGQPIGTVDPYERWEMVAELLGQHDLEIIGERIMPVSRYRLGMTFSYGEGEFLLDGTHWTPVYMTPETKAEWEAWAADLGLPDTFWEEFAEEFEADEEDVFEVLEERDKGPVEWALNRACEILGGDRTQ